MANGVGQEQLGGAPENLQRASCDGLLRALVTIGSTWSLFCTKRAVFACSAGCRAGQCSCGHAGHWSARDTSQTKSWGVSRAEEASMKGEGARGRGSAGAALGATLKQMLKKASAVKACDGGGSALQGPACMT